VCARLSGGSVDCWGYNHYGEVGPAPGSPISSPTAVSGVSGATQVSAGNQSTCAVLTSGSIKCWGYNTDGELGDGNTTTYSGTPETVSGITTATQISAGLDANCALLSNGTVDCWGQGPAGNPEVIANGQTDVPLPVVTATNNDFVNGQLVMTTDPNGKTLSYVYNYDGQVACTAYAIFTEANCGSFGSLSTASPTNTIETRTYDTSGRLSTVSDWMTANNTTTYTYGDANFPDAVTKITYPASTSLTATYGYDSDGNLTSLSAGSAISDAWTYNDDEQVATTKINGSTSAAVGYNANSQITAAANLATSTSNDTYTIAANGEITKDVPPSGTTYSYGYFAGGELCTTTAGSTATSCGSNPSTGTTYAYTNNGQRSSATPYTSGTAGAATYYDWNALGELCNVATASTLCGTQPSSGTSYQYSGNGLRITATTSTTTTDSIWDSVSGGSIPLNVNDQATTSSATTNTSYLYGDPLFGGTAPLEQITTTASSATPVFLVPSPTGVQEVVSASGADDELAVYSVYGKQTVSSGSDVTPFGFQGSYTDGTGLIYLVNRYYDPSTDQFLSIDPDIATTDQPYVFTNDDPLNSSDPLGTAGARFSELSLLEYGKQIKGGTRGGNFPEEAEPNQILYRVDGDHITSYQAYGEDGLPEYRVDLTGSAHAAGTPDEVETPHMFNFEDHTAPDGEVFINKGPVYSAPEEFVPSQEFQSSLIRGDSFADIYAQITGPEGDGGDPPSILRDNEGGEDPILW
jgi:RHS repeat-associated protein